MLRTWLEHPLKRNLDLDDPRTTDLRRLIIEEKPFLRQIHLEWYDAVAKALPGGLLECSRSDRGRVFSIASFRVDHLRHPRVLRCSSGDGRTGLAIVAGTLRGIVMTNVLHHLPDARQFVSQIPRSGMIARIVSRRRWAGSSRPRVRA